MNQKVKPTHTVRERERENKGEYARALFEKKVGGAKSFREKRDLVYPYGIRITEEKKKRGKKKRKTEIHTKRSLLEYVPFFSPSSVSVRSSSF